jgi:hypothetical protein
VPENETVEPSQDDCSPDCDQDGVNGAAVARKAKGSHDPSADDGAGDSYQNVNKRAVAGTAHDFAGNPARNKTHQNPPQKSHHDNLHVANS